MLMFHDARMGLGPTGVCRAPLWPPPQPHWFAPHRPSAMTEVIDDVRSVPPGSPQSDTDSSHSSALSDYRCVDASYYSGYHVTSEAGVTAPTFPCRWRACSDCFNSLDALSGHVAASHADVTGGLFYCGWEGCVRGHRGFNARYKMLVHVRTHTNERPHKCAQCDKSFSRAENLKIHTRSHSGEKPYVCPVQGCNKAYSNSSDRFKHTRTHSVDKPYCCKIAGCQKRYTDPSSLRKHVKTYKHTSVSPKLQENDVEIKKSNQNDTVASRLSQDNIQQSEVRIFESGSTTVRSTASLSESESYEREVKHFQRKYSYSESDRPALENEFKVQYRSQISADNLQDESDRLCFCKDLPCIHTSRYVNPEYISVDSLPYTCQIQSPKLTFTSKLSTTIDENIRKDRYFVSEPLNLKRCSESRFEEIYENGVLNLEKKAKTEFIDKTVCLDTPLDLSNKKTL